MSNITQLRGAVLAGLAMLVLTGGTAIGQIVPAPVTPACACGEFRVVSEMEQVAAGEVAEFAIESDDAAMMEQTFEWTVSPGKIISGQGTTRIRVQTKREMLLPAILPNGEPALPPTPDGESRIRPASKRLHISVTARYADDLSCSCQPVTAAVRLGVQAVPRNRPADVIDLKVSSEVLRLPCAPGDQTSPGAPRPSANMVVDVMTVAQDPNNDVITYNYTVSAGKIVGSGAQVKWDLTGVSPGTYKIDVAADDGGGSFGKKRQKEITAEASGCNWDCVCPQIELTGPDAVLESETATFTSNISGGTQQGPVTYQWEITNGQIVDGQGTPSVQALVSPKTVVRMKIGGLPTNCGCPNELERVYKNGRLQPQP